MVAKVTITLMASELALELGLKHIGPDLMIGCVCPASNVEENALFFSRESLSSTLALPATAIVGEDDNIGFGAALISRNPRLDFARALNFISSKGGLKSCLEGATVHPTASIGKGVTLGDGVKIGAHTSIGNNVVIGEGVSIGERCIIKSGAVIGENGFGFERDETGRPIRLVHLGSVVIGNDVEIGSLSTVCKGTLEDTRIEEFVKVDDHVHVAHNVKIGRCALVTACAELSGGVQVGEGAWIGPNSSVIQKVRIGAWATVGIGANVIRDVPERATVAGNPAKAIG